MRVSIRREIGQRVKCRRLVGFAIGAQHCRKAEDLEIPDLGPPCGVAADRSAYNAADLRERCDRSTWLVLEITTVDSHSWSSAFSHGSGKTPVRGRHPARQSRSQGSVPQE